MILVLIQYALKKSKSVFKIIWLVTIADLFPFEVAQKCQLCQL